MNQLRTVDVGGEIPYTIAIGPGLLSDVAQVLRRQGLRVHDARLVEHVRTVWERWEEYGADRVVPYLFPTPGLLGDLPLREPTAVHGAAGMFGFDTMTLIGPGTWEAARGAIDVALTCVDHVDGDVIYGLTRPPGHHVTRSAYGGSCYLNNAAIAAEALRRAGHERVEIVDIDAHHGNGTQDIFYDRADVLFVSLHGEPAVSYPYFSGFADERGAGAGQGLNLNYPLPKHTRWAQYQAALADACQRLRAFGPEVLVISLGVDTFKDDPISHFRLESEDFLKIGQTIAGIGRPTLFVMEGGYMVDDIGVNAVNVLRGFEAA